MFHSRLIPASPVSTLNYSCSSGVWPHEERTRTGFEMLWPASGSQSHRSEANNAHQARQCLVRMQNTQVMWDLKGLLTVAPLGLFWGEGNQSEPLPSAALQVPASPWISARSHCASPAHVNCEKRQKKGELRQKAASGTFAGLHSDIPRTRPGICIIVAPHLTWS